MPVFGYLLLLNDHVHDYLTIRYDADWLLTYLPSTWRIWMLFYGSFFLAMGSMLFAWRCPAEIKTYASAFNYVDTERPHLTAKNQTQQIAHKVGTMYSVISKMRELTFPEAKAKPLRPELGCQFISFFSNR